MKEDLNIEKFRIQNPVDWKAIIDQLFPIGVPTRAVWTDQQAIIRVLNHIGATRASNYTFFASGGGLDLIGAKAGSNAGETELLFQPGPARVGKISRLIFESFGNPVDYQWDHFRIELEQLAPTGVGYVDSAGYQERLTELAPGEYDSLDKWEYRGDSEEDELPATARLLTRDLKGSMVIFQKVSQYNRARWSDRGLHNEMSGQQFRAFLEEARIFGVDHVVERMDREKADALAGAE